jgi:CheY-like chemotaxis protein
MAGKENPVTIRLVLADDHAILRQGLRSLLTEAPDFQVLGEAGNGLEALKLVERFKPDVLVVDVMMPEMNGRKWPARPASAARHPDYRALRARPGGLCNGSVPERRLGLCLERPTLRPKLI